MTSRPGPGETELETVRAELQRLGYLSDGFGRFLLHDALRPRGAGRALAGLALRVGLLAGIGVSLVLVLALALANGLFHSSPFDLAALFAHVALPVVAVCGIAFLLLAAVLAALLRLYPARRIESLSLGVALTTGAGVAALAASRLHEAAGGPGGWPATLVAALVAALLVAGVVRVVHAGLLSLAIRLTHVLPRTRARPRHWAVVVVGAGLLLFLLPAVLAIGPPPTPPPPALPTAPGDRVLLIGIDGVLPEELAYLLGRGGLPTVRALLADGGRALTYRRPSVPPATFWTTVVTGLAAPDHGVSAVDSFRPLGVSTPLARSGPLRPLWRAEAALGLAEYRPLLAARRTGFAVWELAARGGATAVVVDWWATFPAEPLPGLVLAHGAYQLLADEGAEGAVAPDAAEPEIAALRRRIAAAPPPAPADALRPDLAESVAERALRPDRFYREAFVRALEAAGEPARLAALYLPGIDVAAEGWEGSDLAFADLVRRELERADRALARAVAAQGPGTIAVVFDPGRRGDAAEGRVVLWRRGGCAGDAAGTLEPEQIAAGLVAALGLPASDELPSPPAACSWPSPPARLRTFGIREPARRDPADAAEYLESLRSLGYL